MRGVAIARGEREEKGCLQWSEADDGESNLEWRRNRGRLLRIGKALWRGLLVAEGEGREEEGLREE